MNMILLDLDAVMYMPKDSRMECELLAVEVPQLNFYEEFRAVHYFDEVRDGCKVRRLPQPFKRLLLDVNKSDVTFDYQIRYIWRVDQDYRYVHTIRVRPSETLKNNGCYLVSTNPLCWIGKTRQSKAVTFPGTSTMAILQNQPIWDATRGLIQDAKSAVRTIDTSMFQGECAYFEMHVSDDIKVPPIEWSRYASWLNSNIEQTLSAPTLDNLYQTNLKIPLSSQPVKNEDDQERAFQLFKRENGIENMLMYEDDVSKVTGIPVGTLRDMVKEENGFPRPVRISKRRKAWRTKDIFFWDKSLNYID